MFLTAAEQDAAEAEFEAFLETHDLSRSLQGATVPSVLAVRSGSNILLAADVVETEVAATEFFEVLQELGNQISDRLKGCMDERGLLAAEAWRSRSVIDATTHVEIAASLDLDALGEIQGGTAPEIYWELEDLSSLDLNELLVAARMSSGLAVDDIREVVESLRMIRLGTSDAIDPLALAAREERAVGTEDVPFDQGYAAAQWLRNRLGIPDTRRVDPEALLGKWNVEVIAHKYAAVEIDALSCWGQRHGPAVIVNRDGVHAQGDAGRRATLAHEICHLLFDREGPLPLVEVLRGGSPTSVEARARAFAAEFLLPRAAAARAFWGRRRGGFFVRRGADAALEYLTKEYGVSVELAAWQVRNSGKVLSHDEATALRRYVSKPAAF